MDRDSISPNMPRRFGIAREQFGTLEDSSNSNINPKPYTAWIPDSSFYQQQEHHSVRACLDNTAADHMY